MAVLLRFNVAGIFRYNPCRCEYATVVEWKCEVDDLSYELIVWILEYKMKVNNVGKIFFYRQWDKNVVDLDMDLILVQCEISFEMLVQLAKDKGVVDIFINHDESQPLFIEGKSRILPCDLLPFPHTIHANYFSNDKVELVGGCSFNVDEGVRSNRFPRDTVNDAAPFSPFYELRDYAFQSLDSSEDNHEGVRVDKSVNKGNVLDSGGRSCEEDGCEDGDDSEEWNDSEEDDSSEEDVGIEGGLGHWVSVSKISDDEEYNIIKSKGKKKILEGQSSGVNRDLAGIRNEDGCTGGPEERQSPLANEIGDDSDVSAETNSDGSEAEHGRRRRKTKISYKPTTNFKDIPNLEIGMIFNTAKEFKDAVVEHSLKVHREVEFVKNDKKRIRLKCLERSCKWFVYAMKPKHASHWQLRSLGPDHSCPRKFTNSRINYKIIAAHFIKERKTTAAAMKQRDIKKYSKEELGIEITEGQARRARIQIFKHFVGDYEKEFKRIWDFVQELRDSNPGSTVVLEAPENVFKRMYVCFDALRRGFIEGCRRVLGVDGCFLKGPFKQQLLSVVGRDANDQMFPVAWAVVDVENHSNWMWFLELVKKDLHIMEDGLGWSFQSDQHPSIIHAFRELMPQAECRRCARHIFSKWRKGRDGDLYAELYWSTVKSTNIPELEENLERMYKYDPAVVDAILQVSPNFWCKAFFQCLSKSDVIDNNMCETFNASIMVARHMSIISMLEEIRMLIVQRFVERRNFGNFKFGGDIGPRIRGRIEDNKDKSVYCHVFTNGDGGWEVFEGNMKFIVRFRDKKCSCREWDLTGIPCKHAVAVITHKRERVEDFVAHWYKKDMFMKAYAYSIQPVNDERFRRKTGLPDIIAPPRKLVKGRRRVNRILEKWEPKNGKKVIRRCDRQRCTKCFRVGHNSKTCSTSMNINGGVTQDSSCSARSSIGDIEGSTPSIAVNEPVLSTQNSTTNTEPLSRKRNQHDNILPRPFSGIESFIDTMTGMTMANRPTGIAHQASSRPMTSRSRPSQNVIRGRDRPKSSQNTIATRWFGDYMPTAPVTSSTIPQSVPAAPVPSPTIPVTTPAAPIPSPTIPVSATVALVPSPIIPVTTPAAPVPSPAVQVDTPAITQASIPTSMQPVKRTRGRPKGSTNKKHKGLPS